MITTRDELRAAQAPLKQQYRDTPESAMAAVHASGTFSEPGITATVETWSEPVRAGLHPSTGGDGADACSGDMLMEALVGCAGVTLRSVATAMSIPVRSAEIRAEGVFDARGTLGVDGEAEVGVQNVRILAIIDADATDEQLERLATSTERYCVVGQSLKTPPAVEVKRL
ncbi:OsmC family protein [Sinomonas sp. B1-1]|uniref:OsmC family protein n=1 Tax=Sinomonas sp. B1-1 TaxID=3141454 RepID=UPI003D26F908